MSYIEARVTEIDKKDSLHIVKFEVNDDELTMMSLDLDEKVQVSKNVKLLVKPTNVVLAKSFSGELSFSNKLKCHVDSCTNGKLLSNVKLKYFNATLEAIITLDSSNRLALREGDKVNAFIQASDLSISEILDD